MLLSDADTDKLVTEVFDKIKGINDQIVATIKNAKGEEDLTAINNLRVQRDKIFKDANFTNWFRGQKDGADVVTVCKNEKRVCSGTTDKPFGVNFQRGLNKLHMFENTEISTSLYNIYMKIFLGGETDEHTKHANFIGCISQYVVDVCLGGKMSNEC
jgi:hypothetical protein